MPRTCTVCLHGKRQEIDQALLTGEAFRNIAERFGASIGALYRHKGHLPSDLAKAHEAQEVARADSLLDQLRALQTKTVDILRRAENAGDLRTAVAAIAQARQNLELLGRMTGALQSANVNVLVLPEWVGLRSALVRALDPYPEARRAVILAIEGTSHA